MGNIVAIWDEAITRGVHDVTAVRKENRKKR